VRLSDVRPEVAAFAIAMEEQLRVNDYKGGWRNCRLATLLGRINDELDELKSAVGEHMEEWDGHNVVKEAADVANFALMVADICVLGIARSKYAPEGGT